MEKSGREIPVEYFFAMIPLSFDKGGALMIAVQRRGFVARTIQIGLVLASCGTNAAAADYRIIGYYPEWGVYARNYFMADVPADKLTHLNYAFARVNDSTNEISIIDTYAALQKPNPGETTGTGNFGGLAALKQQHPQLNAMISVGGWNDSWQFSAMASTPTGRETFSDSCVTFVRQYGFDGVDIDWEYPTGGDTQNFTSLLQTLRDRLDAAGQDDGRYYELSIAAPAGPSNIANIELDQIHQHLDFINVMTYDFHGTWENVTNFHSALYETAAEPEPWVGAKDLNVHDVLQVYLAAGVPPDELVMGVPFYGRGWKDVPDVDNGLYQTASWNPPPGTWENGVFDYEDIAENYLAAGSGYTRYWHNEAMVPWVYNPSLAEPIFIGYDDPQSLAIKADYIKQNNLGGVMFWELSGDDDDDTLVETLYTELIPEPGGFILAAMGLFFCLFFRHVHHSRHAR